jgi:hypothetical protein
VQIYQALAASTDVPPIYRNLATLLAVMHQVDTGDAKQLEVQLQPLAAETSPFRFSARELTALLAAKEGDGARAKTLLDQLAKDAAAPPGLRSRAAELSTLIAKS